MTACGAQCASDHQFASGTHIGLIAQEVKAVLPQVVSRGSDGYLSVDYGRLTPVLVEAIKEQQSQVEALECENAKLKSRLERLETMMASLVASSTRP